MAYNDAAGTELGGRVHTDQGRQWSEERWEQAAAEIAAERAAEEPDADDGFDGGFAATAAPEADDEFAGAFAAPDAGTGRDEADDEFAGGFVTPDAMAPADPVIDAGEPAEPRELELLVPDKSFARAPGGGLRVSFDDLDLLKVLNADPVPEDVITHYPDWLRDLDGKRVRLRGFMYPTYADPVEKFILARDNQICCFGRNPKPYDLVSVKLAEGEESSYIQNRPFDVAGTFKLDPVYDGDGWLRLYRIDDARVIE